MKPANRHRARRHALQGLYQVLLTGDDAETVALQHLNTMDMEKVDAEYFRVLILGVLNQLQIIDQLFSPYLVDISIAELTPIELCVLRLSTFELKYCPEIPYRVVINEGLELTKTFGTQEGYKFVNGVLDKTAHAIRTTEKK